MRIKSHGYGSAFVWHVMALIVIGLPAVFLYFKAQDGALPTILYFLMAPFFLLGIVFTYVGTRTFIGLARFGRWELECPDAGGRLGQPLQVTLFPGKRDVTVNGAVQCRLQCVQTIVTKTQRKASFRVVTPGSHHVNSGGRSQMTTVWATTWSVQAATIHPRIGLNLTLPLPDSGRATDVNPRTSAGISWQLSFDMRADGTPVDPVFEVPVHADTAAAGEIDAAQMFADHLAQSGDMDEKEEGRA